MTITREQYMMGRDKLAPPTTEMEANLTGLLIRVNPLLKRIGFEPGVSSGYRPPAINANVPGAAKKSCHMTCEAVDLKDPNQMLATCLALHPKANKLLKEWISLHPDLQKQFTDLLVTYPKIGQTVRNAYQSDKCLLEEFNLYMEHPESTKTWVHLQTHTTSNRVFFPTADSIKLWDTKIKGVKR